MAVADEVIVELRARMDRYEADLARGERRFTTTMRSMEGGATAMERNVVGSFRNVAGAFGLTVGAAGAVAAARAFMQYADAAKNLDSQLRLATQRSGDFGQAQEDVRRIALTTRSDLNETGKLYASIQRNAQELGISQMEAARATETISKAFIVSGATAMDSAAATRQLMQALQSGTLRGDEFNSMMENAPRLARLLADSMGVPIGALRKMAEEGELTSARLMTALTDQEFTAGLDAEFQRMPVTFDQAMTQIDTAAQITFSAFDQGGRFSEMLVSFFTGGSEGFIQMESDAEQMGIKIRAVLEGLSGVWDTFGGEGAAVFDMLGLKIGNLGNDLDRLMQNTLREFDMLSNLNKAAATWAGKAVNIASFGLIPAGSAGPRSNREGAYIRRRDSAQRRGELDAQQREFNKTIPGSGDAFQRFLNEPDRYNLFGERPGGNVAAVIPGKTKKGGGGRKGPSAETLARREEAERQKGIRQEEAYNQDVARFQADILAAKQAIAAASETVAQYELEQVEVERAANESAIKSQLSLKQIDEKQAERLIELNNQLAAARSETITAKEAERKAEEATEIEQARRENALEILRAEEGLAETREDRMAAQLRILDAEYEIERYELETVLHSKDASEAQKKIAEERLRILDQLKAADAEGIRRGNESPGQAYRRRIRETSMADQFEEVGVKALQTLEDHLVSATKKALGLKGAIGDIVGELIRIGIQRRIIGPLADMMFGPAQGGGGVPPGFGGGAGGGGIMGTILTTVASFLGGGRAGGGNVQRGRSYLVGEHGTEIFSPSQSGKVIPNGQLRGGGGGAPTVNQFFTLDARYGIVTSELIEYVNTTARVSGRAAVAESLKAGRAAMPGQLQRFNTLGTV